MPLYDFECNACHAHFEAMVKSTTVPACPACGNTALTRQISMPAPPGKTAGLIAKARSQAKQEGHFSNYSAAERASVK